MANGVASNVITAAAQHVVGRATQRLSGGLRKVSGNLPGTSIGRGGSNNPSLGAPGTLGGKKGKHAVNHMSYPIDVDSDPMQGHYIIFNISSTKAAVLAAAKRKKDMATAEKKMRAEHNMAGPPNRALTKTEADKRVAKHLEENFSSPKKIPAVGALNRSMQLQNMPRKTLQTSIALYMPPSVSVQYGINYAEKEVGLKAELGSGIIKAFASPGDTVSKLTAAVEEGTGARGSELATVSMLTALDVIAPGATTLAQLESGTVITPRMELMFEGVSRRNFSYTFVFIPKSVQEAKIVENIIYTFKENMHPEYSNSETRREMNIPNTFEISYMYQNKTNDFLNKISTCFLKSMDVQYGADRFTAYEPTNSRQGSGPPPQKSQITLGFSELEILSKAHIQQGY